MGETDSKLVFANNLVRYIEKSGRTQKEIAEFVGVATSTFNDWCKGKKYPRMNKVEKLSQYFGIQLSDLIEDKPFDREPEALADVTARVILEPETLAMVEAYLQLAEADRYAVRLMVESLAAKNKKG